MRLSNGNFANAKQKGLIYCVQTPSKYLFFSYSLSLCDALFTESTKVTKVYSAHTIAQKIASCTTILNPNGAFGKKWSRRQKSKATVIDEKNKPFMSSSRWLYFVYSIRQI